MAKVAVVRLQGVVAYDALQSHNSHLRSRSAIIVRHLLGRRAPSVYETVPFFAMVPVDTVSHPATSPIILDMLALDITDKYRPTIELRGPACSWLAGCDKRRYDGL